MIIVILQQQKRSISWSPKLKEEVFSMQSDLMYTENEEVNDKNEALNQQMTNNWESMQQQSGLRSGKFISSRLCFFAFDLFIILRLD